MRWLLLAVLVPINSPFGTIEVDWTGAAPRVVTSDTPYGLQEASCSSLFPADAQVWDRLEGAVLGALIADSLALRDHYEYSLDRTLHKGVIRYLEAPGQENLTPGWTAGPTCFHPKRGAGELTDYGENALWALRSAVSQRVVARGATVPGARFDPDLFYSHWSAAMERHDGYVCMAARATVQQGLGASGGYHLGFTDMPGPARAAALLPAFRHDADASSAARAVCLISHDPDACAVARMMVAVPDLGSNRRIATACARSPCTCLSLAHSQVAHCLLTTSRSIWATVIDPRGECPEAHAALTESALVKQAVAAASAALASAERLDAPGARGEWEAAVSEAELRRTDVALGRLRLQGQPGRTMPKSSGILPALPEALYLAFRYEADAQMALTANAMLGGDSAARAGLIGSWLGARHGLVAIPQRWVRELRAAPEARELMQALRSQADACEDAEF